MEAETQATAPACANLGCRSPACCEAAERPWLGGVYSRPCVVSSQTPMVLPPIGLEQTEGPCRLPLLPMAALAVCCQAAARASASPCSLANKTTINRPKVGWGDGGGGTHAVLSPTTTSQGLERGEGGSKEAVLGAQRLNPGLGGKIEKERYGVGSPRCCLSK